MNEVWAVCLSRVDADTLARLRSRHGLEVCEQQDLVWLRGRGMDEDLDKRLRSLPGVRFEVLSDRQLVPNGCRVPRGYLPDGSWIALSEAVCIEIESPALGAENKGKVDVGLVRGGTSREANLLLTTVDAWSAYADTAPQVRLQHLAFAMNEARDILIRGRPLPPLPGTRLVEQNGVAVPCGWTWAPAVDAAVLRDLLRLEPDDLALLHADGTWDHLRADDFVLASRSAARLTLEGAGHE